MSYNITKQQLYYAYLKEIIQIFLVMPNIIQQMIDNDSIKLLTYRST